MRSFRQQRKERMRLKFSRMGRESQRVQAERRMADITPEFLMDLAANPPLHAGDCIGTLEWRNHLTGRLTRWAVLRGDRINNYQLRSPDGRASKPHGMAWILEKVRHVILTR